MTTERRVLSEKRTDATLIGGLAVDPEAEDVDDLLARTGAGEAASRFWVSRLADSRNASAGPAMDFPPRSMASLRRRPITLMILLLRPSGLKGFPRYSETPPLTASTT